MRPLLVDCKSPRISTAQKVSASVLIYFFSISNLFGLSITEEALLVEVSIWRIKIDIVLVLYFNPWVEASASGL
jgi:hypothetical protein